MALGRDPGSLVEPLSKGSFKPCDHQLNTSSLHHWEMSLLGRRDLEEKYKLGFPVGTLRLCNGDGEGNPPFSTSVHLTVASKERMSETVQWQSESNYEEKLHPLRVNWDLSLFPQQKLFPELYRISPHFISFILLLWLWRHWNQ